MSIISRQAYADMFGPTTGDRVRLADTDLWLEVEKDFTIYGDEVKFGGGKVIRDGQGQGQALSRGSLRITSYNVCYTKLLRAVASAARRRNRRLQQAARNAGGSAP